jgi:hypothetical protein
MCYNSPERVLILPPSQTPYGVSGVCVVYGTCVGNFGKRLVYVICMCVCGICVRVSVCWWLSSVCGMCANVACVYVACVCSVCVYDMCAYVCVCMWRVCVCVCVCVCVSMWRVCVACVYMICV